MSNLDRDLAEMRRLGYTSYGKYKQDYLNTKVEGTPTVKPRQCEPPAKYRRECAYCRKVFVTTDHRKTFCSDQCKRNAAKKRYNDRKREKKPKQIGYCIICGASFPKIRVTHICCGPECKAIRNRQVQDAWRKRLKEEK